MRSVAVVEVYRDVAQVMAGGCELADESLQCRSDGCIAEIEGRDCDSWVSGPRG